MNQVKLWNPYHSSLLLQKANEMRLSEMFCDVHIKVGHQDFHAHSLVLACASRTFQALFQGHSSRAQDHTKHYNLDFLTGKTFQQILEYSYTESLEARVEDLSSILAAAEALEMEFLASECLKSLGSLSSQSQKIKAKVLGNPTADILLKKEADSNSLIGKSTEFNRSPCQESHSNPVNGIVQGQKWYPTTLVRTESDNLSKASLIESSGSLLANGHEKVNKMAFNLIDSNTHPASPSKRKVDSEDPITADNTSSMVEETENSHNFGNSSFKTRDSVITSATTTTMHQNSQIPENRARHWSPEMIWGSDGMVALKSNQSFQPAVPLVSYQLRAFPPSFPMMSPPHTTLSSSVGFPGCVNPFPKGLLHSEHGSRKDLTESSMREVVNDNGGTTMEVQLMKQPKVQDITCHFCGRCFLDTLHLRLHLHSHACNRNWPRSCPRCGVLFSSEEELKIHNRSHTKGNFAASSSFSIDHCTMYGKNLSSHNAQQEHITTHTGGWGYRCAECDTEFPSQTALRKHLRTHAGNHHYECEFCGRYFRDEILLKNHKRVHAGEKPYECNRCGKKFSLKHQLETHLRVHTGEKPFECNLCHQRSRDYSAMIKHLRTHNGAAPYRCTVCLEFCPSLSAMQKHMKSHRMEEIPANWSIEKTYLYTYSS
ncbi:zinc finger and BTB domain-containing protein 16-A [Microcaecilia unicolor]|uniref:Zinc finger and BTB domain-containing protein 16-A-like n=1 Tax=Microcaecilia unicolor TaxID=1415580 RepID=A0A6P7YPI1_9AMPH|nr:zinc finger and BTB domain-containing protein 16-A-like [Microcaecilia unicolor]